MAELKLEIPNELKLDIDENPNIDWDEVVREALIAKAFELQLFKSKALQRAIFESLIAKSKLNEGDAKELADKVNKSMFNELKKEFEWL